MQHMSLPRVAEEGCAAGFRGSHEAAVAAMSFHLFWREGMCLLLGRCYSSCLPESHPCPLPAGVKLVTAPLAGVLLEA